MSVSSKKLDKYIDGDFSRELEKSCKVSKESLDEKEEILPEISSKDIEKFNDTLSDNGYCDIKEYKKHFLKYFNTHLKEYYDDFEGYFSDSDSDEKSCKEKKNIELKLNFKKALIGYHMVNKNSLKEAQWEEINSQILTKSNCTILEEANGSHKSGCDLKSCIGKFSNKTTKQAGEYYNISSYRLTTVCSENNIGTISDILDEINKRDTTFESYSILARDELENKINYKWYLIPKSTDLFNPKKYNWKKKNWKKGKK